MIYSISDLSVMLARRAEEVAQMLLPNGHPEGGKWRAGSVEGEDGNSLEVELNNGHAGHWRDWNGGAHGDLIDLWRDTRKLSIGDTLRQVKEWLGIADPRQYKGTKSYSGCPDNEKIKDLNESGRAFAYLTRERRLSPYVINGYQIQGDGESMVFPYYDTSGKLVNRSYIKLERDDRGRKIVRIEKNCPPTLFGWQAIPRPFTRMLVITEGQIDAMTWATWGVPAVSIPSGSNLDWIDTEWETLQMFSDIYLSFDMDEAGRDLAKKAARRLGLHRCRIVELPHKDANECLQKGMTMDQAKLALSEATHIQHSGIRSASDYTRETLRTLFPDPKDISSCFTCPMLKGWDGRFEFFPGDVSIWSGIAGHGKTTLLSNLMVEAIRQQQKVFICSLEMLPGKLLATMVRISRHHQHPSREEVQATLNALAGRLIFADKVGSIPQFDLFEMMQFAWSRYGINHFVIDSLMRVEGLEENYPAQGDFLNKLQSFSKGTDSHVHLVAHPRKTAEETRPSKLDIKGSSLLFNNCDNLIIIHKNMEKEQLRRSAPMTMETDAEMYDAELVSEKQREGGWTGRVMLRFDRATHAFTQWREENIDLEIANGGIVYETQAELSYAEAEA